jgi:TatD DNase family protein
VLELVNQYPQEFDDAIPFYSIGIHPWYIVAIVEADLGKVNCKKRIVLPWANAVGQKD